MALMMVLMMVLMMAWVMALVMEGKPEQTKNRDRRKEYNSTRKPRA